jgi:RimJ/RimL family protein N-acetyltransferase
MPEGLAARDVITTDRLILRPITREDAMAGLRGEAPEGLTYAEGYPDENAREALERAISNRERVSGGFSIIRRAQNEIIGGIGYWFPAGPNRPSVGYDIVEPLWNKGYATEALRGLLGHLLAQPSIDAVEADTLESHVASRRVMEKAGMTHFDTREVEVDGKPAILVYYEAKRPPST